MEPEYQEVENFRFCIQSMEILISDSDKWFVEQIIRQNVETCCNQTKSQAFQMTCENEHQYYDNGSQEEIMQELIDQYEQQNDFDENQEDIQPFIFEFSTTNHGQIRGFGDIDQNHQENLQPYYEDQYQHQSSQSSQSSGYEDQQNQSNYSLERRPNPDQDQTVDIQGEQPLIQEFGTNNIYYFNNGFYEFYVPNNKQIQGLSQDQISKIKQINWTCAQLEQSSEQCTICIQDIEIGDEVMILKCNHNYHSSCLKLWLKVKSLCPNCRHSLKSIDK